MAYGNLNVDTITGSGASSVIVNNGSANVAGFTTGNNLQMLQNGGGIVFSNSSATTNSTLNDYETGSWTPVVTSSTGSITSYTSSGYYSKVGRIVTCWFTIKITNGGTAGGQLQFSGLPFTTQSVGSVSAFVNLSREDQNTGNSYACFNNSSNSTSGYIASLTNGAASYSANATYSQVLVYNAQF